MFKVLKGMLYGIAIGILIAPHKGTKTRRKIKEMIYGYKDDAEDALQQGKNKLKSGKDKMEAKIKNAIG